MENLESEGSLEDKILKRFKLLRDEAAEDCKFDKMKLADSFGVTNHIIKWINKKNEWSALYRSYELKRKKAYIKAYEFYKIESPLKLNTKEEYALFIESDKEYSIYYNRSIMVKEVLQYIDSVIETLKSKSWEIKTYIEYQKFQNGVS